DAQPFTFNPLLTITDTSGTEIVTNLYRHVGGDGDDWINTMERKSIYSFDHPGEYILNIHDLTRRFGDEHFKYRVLIRPQIPYVGDFEIKDDHINISRGTAKKISIKANQEEGYTGDIAITVESLPFGVTAVPAAEVDPPKGIPFETIHEERYVPKSQKVTIL